MKTIAEVVAAFPRHVASRYDFSSAVYAGALVRIEGIICPQHGKFSQYAAQLRKDGAGCPKCGAEQRVKTVRTPEEEYIARVLEVHAGKGYTYANCKFTKMNAYIQVNCPKHGAFTIRASKHLYAKEGCQVCAKEVKQTHILKYRHLAPAAKVANTGKSFFQQCSDAHAGIYTYPEQEYKGAKHKISIICQKHGVFRQAAWNHLSGKGCRQCVYKSKPEATIAAFVYGLGFKVDRGRRDVTPPREIDVWVPERNIGIEYHGLYHHTTNKKGKAHREKWELAQRAGVRLVQIFEDEWLQKQEIVENRLRAILGAGEQHDARKCRKEIVAPTEAKAFLQKHHIQGGGINGVHYGLRGKDGVLLAVASFQRSRSGAMVHNTVEGVWEVLRYASVGRVRGGFTRLFKMFLSDVQPDKVISYCDLRYGDGKLYAASGFTLEGITEPDYWWVPKGKQERVPRYATQKHKIAKKGHLLHAHYAPHLSESQICAAAGWEKIHGVGSQKWVWNRP